MSINSACRGAVDEDNASHARPWRSGCTGYYTSVVKTLLFFKDEYPGIEIDLRLLSLSILPLARNLFASLVLEDKSYTHLLFVDSDMGFSPSLIAKMIAFQKPVVGDRATAPN